MPIVHAPSRIAAAAVLALLALLPLALPGSARAQDPVNRAAEQVRAMIPPAVLDQLDTAWDGARKAKMAYDEAMEANNQMLMNQRWEEVKARYADLYRAEHQADESRVGALSRVSGHSAAEIRAMRESGKGWGVIAKELNVPASSLGLGHGRGDPVERAAQKAQRDKELDQKLKKDKNDKGDKGDKGDKNKMKNKNKGNGKGHWGA